MEGKLSVPGHPTNLGNNRGKAYCVCSRCGLGCLDIFSLVYLFFLLLGRRPVRDRNTVSKGC